MVSVVIALVITASVGSGVLFISGGRTPFVGGARSTTADSVKPILAGYTSSISSGRTTPVEWLEMYFTTPLQETLTTDNFRITRDGEPLDTSGILIEHNPGGTTDNWILSNLGPLNAREGEYVLEFIEPPGGHAVYVDAGRLMPHIPPAAFPGQALAVELYRQGAIRGVELGSVAFAFPDPDTGEMVHPKMELVRLAIPRRVYTQAHMDYVAKTLAAIKAQATDIQGYRITYAPRLLRHFTARFEPLD